MQISKFILLLSLALSCGRVSSQTISLSGKWDFAVGDVPIYSDSITIPGSMLTNGKGDDVSLETPWTGSIYDSSFYFNPYLEPFRQEGNIKFTFFLTPEKHYVGKAWYAKDVEIPQSWDGHRVILFLERPHIETLIIVNGNEAGRDSSLSVPHEFDITNYVKPGKNRIEISVYNGIENVCVGQDSHSVTDQTQGNWNGIVGKVELRRRPLAYISDVQIYPNQAEKEIKVALQVADFRNDSGSSLEAVIGISGYETNAFSIKPDEDGRAFVSVPMPEDLKLWDEFEPNIYNMVCILGEDTMTTQFGVRDFTISGRQFYINGRKTWLRGTVENCCFPLTGYPPTDEESWLKIFRKCKEYGLNMMRFHSYCPPEAAFSAADKVGIYLQPEGPSWPNHGVRLGRGMPIDEYLLEETKRMVKVYGNHPSFCMLAAGNEPAGDWVSWVGDFVDFWKESGDSRRVYCGASVGGGWAFDPKSEYHVKGGAKSLSWSKAAPQSVDDHFQAITHFTQKGSNGKNIEFEINEPYVCHELGQWCSFPDLSERSQYNGAYKALNFDVFEYLLEKNGMKDMGEKFLMSSGKLQMLAYKYDIERNLRTKDFAGFQMLSLNDYSGQGTALVGPLNVFWKEKAYCSPSAWREFCSPIVPLAKFPKFVYSNKDTLEVEVELYNAGSQGLSDVIPEYVITDSDGKILSEGKFESKFMEVGKNIPLGTVSMELGNFQEAERLTLRVSCGEGNNSWNFFVYPSEKKIPEHNDIYISDTLDSKAQEVLKSGGKVLIEAAGKVTLGSDVVQEYLPVFWNTSWFKMRPPHTTGVYIDTSHPLFRYFKTEDWADLNWWEMVNKAQVINLMELPSTYQPPVQPIDTWHVSRKLGMIVEAEVMGGKLFLTTLDLEKSGSLVASDMKRAILEYMESESFSPSMRISLGVVANLFSKMGPNIEMFTKDSPDELKPKL